MGDPCWFCDGTGTWPPVPLDEPIGDADVCPECKGYGTEPPADTPCGPSTWLPPNAPDTSAPAPVRDNALLGEHSDAFYDDMAAAALDVLVGERDRRDGEP